VSSTSDLNSNKIALVVRMLQCVTLQFQSKSVVLPAFKAEFRMKGSGAVKTYKSFALKDL